MKYEVKDTNASSKFITNDGHTMLVNDIVKELNSVESLRADLAKVTAERDAICSMIIDLDDMCVDSEEYGELGLELLASAQDQLGLVDRVRMQELHKQANNLTNTTIDKGE